MKKILILCFSCCTIFTFAQPYPVLYWRFTNPVESYDTCFKFSFDVEISCDMAGTFHSNLQMFIKYDTLIFRPDVVSNGVLEYERLDLLQGTFGGNDKYTVTVWDANDSCIAIGTDAFMFVANPLFMNDVPVFPAYAPLIRITLRGYRRGIMDLGFDQGNMNGGQYYVDATHPAQTKYGDPAAGFQGVYTNIPNNHIGIHMFTYNLRIFLEGPYDDQQNLMRTDLLSNGILPLMHPFNPPLPYYGNMNPGWLYVGSDSLNNFPPDIVDWVLVEIRDALDAVSASANTTMVKQPFLLQSNGDIVNASGNNQLEFSTDRLISQGLFIVIWHRNHLAVMNPALMTPSDNDCWTIQYDYSTSSNQVNGGVLGCKELEPGVWGMIAGDGNADKQINNLDRVDVWSLEAGFSGYLGGDFNLDSQINNIDKTDLWKVNGGCSSHVPD